MAVPGTARLDTELAALANGLHHRQVTAAEYDQRMAQLCAQADAQAVIAWHRRWRMAGLGEALLRDGDLDWPTDPGRNPA
jgi:hypothetical protein